MITALPPEISELERLTHLGISNNPITDADSRTLKQITKLQYINVEGTRFTLEGIAALQAALPNCKIKGLPAADEKGRKLFLK